MRLDDLQKSIDIMEISTFEMQRFFNKNPHLMNESAYDFKEYRSKIDTEKQYTIDISSLVKGTEYAPLLIRGAPIGQYIQFISTDNTVKFDHILNNRLYFKNNINREIIFPAKDQEIGDACNDIFIFAADVERSEFLDAMSLSFNGWHINTRYI